MRSDRYYEAHVTVEAGPQVLWDAFAGKARAMGWRASRFDEDEVDDMSGKWFLSFRHEQRLEIIHEVGRMVGVMSSLGHEVLRWKIEDTVLDSKLGDTLEAAS